MSITCSDIGILYRIGRETYPSYNARLSLVHENRTGSTFSILNLPAVKHAKRLFR